MSRKTKEYNDIINIDGEKVILFVTQFKTRVQANLLRRLCKIALSLGLPLFKTLKKGNVSEIMDSFKKMNLDISVIIDAITSNFDNPEIEELIIDFCQESVIIIPNTEGTPIKYDLNNKQLFDEAFGGDDFELLIPVIKKIWEANFKNFFGRITSLIPFLKEKDHPETDQKKD